jgi:hypothetical protein
MVSANFNGLTISTRHAINSPVVEKFKKKSVMKHMMSANVKTMKNQLFSTHKRTTKTHHLRALCFITILVHCSVVLTFCTFLTSLLVWQCFHEICSVIEMKVVTAHLLVFSRFSLSQGHEIYSIINIKAAALFHVFSSILGGFCSIAIMKTAALLNVFLAIFSCIGRAICSSMNLRKYSFSLCDA